MPYTYKYPRPSLTADVIALAPQGGKQCILLIRRGNEPFKDCWALPGGFVNEGETPLEAAAREFNEETGLEAANLRQFFTYGQPCRDPRGWTVTVAHITQLPEAATPHAADDAALAQWFGTDELPPLAFDHKQIIDDALRATNNRK